MPIALHVLRQEAVWMNKMFIVIFGYDESKQRGHNDLTVCGCIVDNFFF